MKSPTAQQQLVGIESMMFRKTELIERLTAVLENCTDFPVADRAQFASHAENIFSAMAIGMVQELPRNTSGGAGAAVEKLNRLRDYLYGAYTAVNDLPLEGSRPLDDALRQIRANNGVRSEEQRNRIDELGSFAMFLMRVATDVDTIARALENASAGSTGRRKKSAAAAVAAQIARSYACLAGKEPTVKTPAQSLGHKAHGAFLDLLKEVFAVLAIEASPEAQARAALKEKKAPPELE